MGQAELGFFSQICENKFNLSKWKVLRKILQVYNLLEVRFVDTTVYC